MKNIFKTIYEDKKLLLIKILILIFFVLILTGADLIVKQIVETNLSNRTDVIVIPMYWHFTYVKNDDIGFSLLSVINTTSKLKIFFIIQIIGIFIAIGFLMDIKKKSLIKIILLSIIVEIFILAMYLLLLFISNVYNTSGDKTKWIILVCLQGFGSLVVISIFLFSNKIKYLIPLALIVSGALGNTIDRIIRHYVVDYVKWSFPFIPINLLNPWPIFNLADVYTVIGAILLFIILMFFSKDEFKDNPEIPDKDKIIDNNTENNQ